MAPRTLAGLLCLAALLLPPSESSAKRAAPTEVDPVQWEGLEIRVIPWGEELGRHQNGGYLEAVEIDGGKKAWTRWVYKTKYSSRLEHDAQDVFITAIFIKHDILIVRDELDRVFHLDPKNGRVILDPSKVK